MHIVERTHESAWNFELSPEAVARWLARLWWASALVDVAIVALAVALPTSNFPIRRVAPLIAATALASAELAWRPSPSRTRQVVSVAAPLFASWQENRAFGFAVRRAIEASPFNVAVLASGSLSHKLVPNDQVGDNQWEQVGSEFNRQMDLRVVDLWRERRYKEFCAMLPEYSTKCNGEALMCDTHMLFGMLGWGEYDGEMEELTPYFPSSGSGQINVEFHLPK